MFGIRAPLPLVAALLVIAIAVAVLVGGLLWQGWNAQHVISPAGGVGLPTLAELEARPWQHPVLADGDQCAGDEINGLQMGSGAPLWANPIAGPFTYNWGEYSRGEAVFQKGFSGLLIVRLRDGQKGQNHFFINEHAGGAVVGTVVIDGQTVERHAEAVFDFSDPRVNADGAGNRIFKFNEGHLNGFSHCFEWQFDGTYQGRPFVWHWYFFG